MASTEAPISITVKTPAGSLVTIRAEHGDELDQLVSLSLDAVKSAVTELEGAVRGVDARRVVTRLHRRHLQQVVAAAGRLLREGARPAQALHPDLQQQLVLVHQRGVQTCIRLPGRQWHPIDAVLGKELQPLLVAALVDQPRLAQHEVDEFAVAGVCHARTSGSA